MQVRDITDNDHQTLQDWIENDPDHRDTNLEFFTQARGLTHVWEDQEGTVMFVKLSKSLRIDIQFDENNEQRNAQTIVAGLPVLAAQARDAGFEEIIFCSKSPKLVAFLRKIFKFQAEPDEFRLSLI